MSLKGKMVFPVFGSDFGFFVFAFPLAFWACSWPFRGSVVIPQPVYCLVCFFFCIPESMAL